jgi:hypothetical protein
MVDSDSGTAPESLREEDNNNSRGITWISSGKLENSPYLVLMDRPNGLLELGYKS